MKLRSLPSLLLVLSLSCIAFAQNPAKLSEKEIDAADALFEKGNSQLKNKEYTAALATYEAALKIIPDDPSILYNGGFSALLAGANEKAIEMLSRLKSIEPDDWQARAKLIQAYQALNKSTERDKEREELLALRKSGKNKELNQQTRYCRDRFEAGGRSVMAFELFEFNGPRAIRYIYSVMSPTDSDKEDYRISLGSYDLTNGIWRETTKPKPKEGVRLFHLDGYFANGHATYGMMVGEPSYEATKKMVIGVLEKKISPASSTVVTTQKP